MKLKVLEKDEVNYQKAGVYSLSMIILLLITLRPGLNLYNDRVLFSKKRRGETFCRVKRYGQGFMRTLNIMAEHHQRDRPDFIQLQKDIFKKGNMLDDYDDATVKIVEHDDVMSATLVQLAQEFDLELV